MSKPEACKQLRLEYFKWMTASNNPNAFKKNLSKKNLNEIIKLRNKLKCQIALKKLNIPKIILMNLI